MPKQERITPTEENKEAQRMLNEAEQRQEAERARSVGHVATEGTEPAITEALLDDIDAVLAEQGLHTEAAAKLMVDSYLQKGGE